MVPHFLSIICKQPFDMNFQRYYRLSLWSLCLLVGFHQLANAQSDSQATSPVVRLGTIKSPDINESSGLAYCGSKADAIWTINDSGNTNELFLLATSGEQLGSVSLVGINNLDWETMTPAVVNGKRHLIVGDVGDNREKRRTVFLYLFPEPQWSTNQLEPESVKPVKIEFRYPDGSHNCEAIAYEQKSNKLWLIEKRYVDDRRTSQPGVYELTLPTKSTKEPITASRIGDFPVRNVTGMSFSPDGNRLIIRNYLNAHLFTSEEGKSWKEVLSSQKPKSVVLPIQRQGEAICFTPDSKGVIVTSEFKRQPVWQINLESLQSTSGD